MTPMQSKPYYLTMGLVAVIAGVVASALIQRSGKAQFEAEDALLAEQAEAQAQLQAEFEHRTNQVSQVPPSLKLSTDQEHELLRLRNEVGQLRGAAPSEVELLATNAVLRAKLDERERQLAAARAAPNFWAREKLEFAGYGTPEAGIKSILWAMSRGEFASLAECMEPEGKAKLQDHLASVPPEFQARATEKQQELIRPLIGYRILDQTNSSPSEIVFTVSYDGMGQTRKFTLRNTEAEWKLHEMGELE
jgi:hypothetical protein